MKSLRYFDRIIIGLLIALILGLPIFFDVRLYSVFDLSKVGVLLLLGLTIMGVWLIKIIYSERFEFPTTPLNIPILAYISITIIATIFSINPYMSLMGGYKRFEGLIETCTYIFLFFAFVTFVKNRLRLNLVMNAMVVAAVITSFYGFIQYLGHDPFRWSSTNPDRIFSTFGNPVFYSAFLITTLPISLALYLGYQGPEDRRQKAEDGRRQMAETSRGKQWLKDIGYGSYCLLIYTIFWHTKTRADFVGLIVLLPLFFVFLGRERIYAKRWKISVIIILFVIIGIFYSVKPGSSVFSYFAQEISLTKKDADRPVTAQIPENNPIDNSDINNDRSFLAKRLSGSSFNRYYQFKTALKIFNDYPILGIGPDTLGIVYQGYLAKVFTRKKEDEWWPRHDRIHNDILDNVVARGSIGLLTYVWLLSAYFWMVWKFLKYEGNIAFKGIKDSKSKARDLRLIDDQPTLANSRSLIDKRLLVASFGSAIAGYLVQNEFSFGNTPIVALFWMILALTTVVIKRDGLQDVNCTSNPYISLDPGQGDPQSTLCQFQESAILNPRSSIRKVLLSLLVVSLTSFLAIQIQSWYKADMYMEKGRRHCNANDFNNGLVYFEQALLRNPFETMYRDLFNNALFQVANITKERIWLEKIINLANKNLELIPQHSISLLTLGNAYYLLAQNFGENTLDTAIEYYKKAVEADPFQADFYHHMAVSYGIKGMLDEGADAMEKAVIMNPSDVNLLDKLARFYLQQNKLDKLQKLLDEAPPISNPTVSFYNIKGIFYLKTGQYEKALIEFQSALVLNPDDMPSLGNIINLCLIQNKMEDAVKYLVHAIELNPSNIEYRTKLAEIYAQKGLYNEAIAEFNQIIQIDHAREVDCMDKMGKVYLVQRDFDNAILCFTKAIEIGSSSAELYNNLGTVYAQKGEYDKAIPEIEHALKIEPDNIIFLENIAKIYLVQERFLEAEVILNHILKLNGDHETSRTMLEKIRQKMAN